MALALSASASLAFNPVHAAISQVAKIGIVGFDKRAFDRSFAELPSPRRAVSRAAQRVAERIVMEASVPDQKPKVVGDMGFDPLRLGGDDNFAFMREAEVKHGRLAMLAAIAWPLQEIFHPIIADVTGANNALVESHGASPSVLNGGLLQWEVLPALLLFTAGCEALERGDLTNRKELGCAWNEYPNAVGLFGRLPGNFGFDPLNFYRPLSAADKIGVQERELTNGRVAMMAVATYVGVEFVSGQPIVDATPALFTPIIAMPWFVSIMDASFGVASAPRTAQAVSEAVPSYSEAVPSFSEAVAPTVDAVQAVSEAIAPTVEAVQAVSEAVAF